MDLEITSASLIHLASQLVLQLFLNVMMDFLNKISLFFYCANFSLCGEIYLFCMEFEVCASKF